MASAFVTTGATEILRPLTYEDLPDAPDDRLRREIPQGELVLSPSPPPPHQVAVAGDEDTFASAVLAGLTVDPKKLFADLTVEDAGEQQQ